MFPPPPPLGAPRNPTAGSGTDQILEIKGCIVIIRGDIFSSNHSIAYSVTDNLRFDYGMSAEIARRFSPVPKLAQQSKKSAGDVYVFVDQRANPQRYVYTLIMKQRSFQVLEKCLENMREHAKRNNVKTICVTDWLGICPEEGLQWPTVEAAIKRTFTGTDINVFIYTKN